MRRKRGQSVLEYVIVLTAIIAAIAFAARTFIAPKTELIMEKAGDAMETAADNFPIN